MIRMNSTLYLLFFVVAGIAVILSIALFFVCIFPNKPKKSLKLYSKNEKHLLDEKTSQYLERVAYIESEHSVSIKRKGAASSISVILVTKSQRKSSMATYDLNFGSANIVDIPLPSDVDSYRVIVERVNGKLVKHEKPKLNNLVALILYTLPVAVVGIGAVVIYGLYARDAIILAYPEFIKVYIVGIVLVLVLTVGLNVGLFFLNQYVFLPLAIKKGGKAK